MEVEDDQEEVENKCAVCPLAAEKSCSACHSASYCSVEHQKLDWKNHKKNCNAYKVETNEELGRHLVASRDLKAGTLVLKENPVSTGPKVTIPISEVEERILLCFPLCLGCCCAMKSLEEQPRRCSKCKWPICSVSCEKMPHHAENECAHFAKTNVEFCLREYMIMQNDNSILTLRACLMKHKDVSKWLSILNLQHESSLGREQLSVQKNRKRAEKLLEFFKLSEKVTVNDWIRVANVAAINALEVLTEELEVGLRDERKPRRRMVSILTLKGSMLSHSCSSNCGWAVTVPSGDMNMQVRTTVDVVKGEILSITYNKEFNTLGTMQRRKAIRHFLCKCPRCMDPTEFGSNFSTLVCPKCRAPRLISTNPLKESSPWQCGSCMFVEMNAVLKILGFVSTFENLELIEDPKKVQALIANYSGIHLHQNHWLLMRAFRELTVKLDVIRKIQELGKPERELYISSAQHVLRVANILSPGISKERAFVQKMLSKEILVHVWKEYSRKNLSLVEFRKKLKTVEEFRDEAYKFFKVDCEEAENGKKSPWVYHFEELTKFVNRVYLGDYTEERTQRSRFF